MKLRVFLPAHDVLEPAARLRWMLFDARGNLLRTDACALAEVPRGDEVEVVLPAERVLFARTRLPKVSAATIRELLPFAVEDRLLADPANVHAVPGRANARGETVVAVVDRAWLAAMLDALTQAGLKPAHAFSEGALLAGGRDDWHVVLGPARGMLVDDEGVSATFDRGEGFPLAARIALDEAAARGARPGAIRVHTEAGVALPDLERWSAEGGVPFAAGTQWEAIARGQVASDSIDLLQGDFAPRRRRVPALPRAAAWLVGLLAAGQLAFSAAHDWSLRRERAELEARREAIFRTAFPEAKVVVDPELQMARNLAELKRSRGLAGGDDFLAQMTRVAHGANERVRVIEYANGRLVAR